VPTGCLHEDEQQKILFATDRDGDYALYTMEEDGRGQSRILGLATAPSVAPIVSPDGRSVLFVGNGLWVLGLEEGRRTQLVRGRVFDAAWSPDGERVAYSWGGGLSVVRRDGTARLRLTRRGGDGAPAWSPDGRRIAYAAEDGVWVIGSNGGVRTYLTRLLTSYPTGPVWSPDGDQIAFVGGEIEARSTTCTSFRSVARPSGSSAEPSALPPGRPTEPTSSASSARRALALPRRSSSRSSTLETGVRYGRFAASPNRRSGRPTGSAWSS
jgi:Tol biopolymer transport system component